MRGTVKRIKENFFFITDEDGHDRFAHENDLINTDFSALTEGAAVEFEPIAANAGGSKRNGLRALNVRLIA